MQLLLAPLLCNIHVSSDRDTLSQSEIGNFTSAKSKSHMIVCYELVGESTAWVSRTLQVLARSCRFLNLSRRASLRELDFIFLVGKKMSSQFVTI